MRLGTGGGVPDLTVVVQPPAPEGAALQACARTALPHCDVGDACERDAEREHDLDRRQPVDHSAIAELAVAVATPTPCAAVEAARARRIASAERKLGDLVECFAARSGTHSYRRRLTDRSSIAELPVIVQ